MVRRYGVSTIVLGILFFTALPVFARQQLTGHVPKEAATAPLLGDMDQAQTLNLSISLPFRNLEEMERLVDEIYDPHSSSYRRFLTPQETAARFGPDPADYQAVLDFLSTHHFKVTKTYTQHSLVCFQGRVDDIQKAFHVRLKRYSREGGGEFHAPDREPFLDLDVPLEHIQGLENAQLPRHSSPRQPLSTRPRAQMGTGSTGLYMGNDFRNIYFPGLPNSYLGAGQTIALIEFDVYTASDVSLYAQDAAITTSAGVTIQPTLSNVLLDGTQQNEPGGNDDEVTLDIEMAFAMAPQATICVYEQSLTFYNPLEILNDIEANPGIHQISSSWLYSGVSAANFNMLALQGQACFQCAGDHGSYISSGFQTAVPNPIYYSPNMTVVGATTLSTSGNTYTGEKVWNNGGVSGGGICSGGTGSATLAVPAYQDSVIGVNGASGAYRNIPDVTFVGDQVELVYGGIMAGGASGTSASAPLWAGISALINQYAAVQSKGPVGLLNASLYNLASNATTYANDFNDITVGNNNYYGTDPGAYAAGTGYDLASGLGSPKTQLIYDIVGLVNTPTNTSTVTVTQTSTNTRTPTSTATNTATSTATQTTSNTPTATSTATVTNSATFTVTLTFSATASTTNSATITSTSSSAPTQTSTRTVTLTPTITSTPTTTPTPTATVNTSIYLSANLFDPLAGGNLTVHYGVLSSGSVKVTVCDLVGRQLQDLVNGNQGVGTYTASWDGKENRGRVVASGIYFIVIEESGKRQLLKVLVVK
jgi:subtilase family serine protease